LNDRQKKKKRKYIESFDTVDALAANTNLDKRLIDGQIIRILRPEEGKPEFYKYWKEDFIPLYEWPYIEEENPEMTLYEANKQLFAGAPQFDVAQLERAEETINEYGSAHNNIHYMLLGHDIRYYTIFSQNLNITSEKLGHAVIDCLENIGQIKEIVLDEETDAIECWVTTYQEKETIVLYLFPYDTGIVYYGGFN
jgi:hypothetical protein